MASRGHVPSAFEGRSIQAPGMMRHGSVPGLGPPNRHPMEPFPPEILENKVVVQGAEMDKLARENQRLAATHGALRQELLAAQQEMQRLQAHAARMQSESDVQIKGIMDKISRMEEEIKSGEIVMKELHQAHSEAHSLLKVRPELASQIQHASEELQQAHTELKKLPEAHAELDGLIQEHQKLRFTFEREKASNMDLVQQMHAMDKNMGMLAREVEKLRAEVQNAERKANVPIQHQSAYGSPDSSRTPALQAASYPDVSYGQGGSFSNAGYGSGGGVNAGYTSSATAGYTSGGASGGYALGGGTAVGYTSGGGAANAGYGPGGGSASGYGPGGSYMNNSYVQAAADSYSDLYGKSQIQMSGAGMGDGMTTYSGGNASAAHDSARANVGSAAVSYDSARAGASTAAGYDSGRAGLGAAVMYDPVRAGMGSGLAYDTSRVSAGGQDAARAASGAIGMYDPARGGLNSSNTYDPVRAGMSYSNTYDATRGSQHSNQR